MEVALFVVQLGGRPLSAKPWKGLGSGVFEIVDAAMMSKTRKAAASNVLEDLGFEDAEELTAKAILALKANEIFAARGLTQIAAAKLVGMPQSKISQIRNYRLQNISLERLMHVLVALDQHVEIVVTPALSVGSS